ncbi:MAG: histidinol-phosphatase [Proteobacteria bacterium]|nr:histidinol-phosphatase [Pseudomonadota bacterium]MBU1714865.1 histidinol-phosphatase [Pseudomonadota bacterium]
MIDLKIDGHVHTTFCHHAIGTMEEYVVYAMARGLSKVIFLEHLEVGINYPESTWLTGDDFEKYFQEGRRLQQKYRGDIEVGLGVEVGYNPERREEIRDFLTGYKWDRVGISYHYMEIEGRHYNVVSRKPYSLDALAGQGVDKVVSRYLRTLREAVEFLPGNVLCHLDAVMRYHPAIAFDQQHLVLVGELFEAMVAREMALEINTSGYLIRGGPFPALNFIRQAQAMGLPLVAGSDAHRPEDVGRFFDRLLEINHQRNNG